MGMQSQTEDNAFVKCTMFLEVSMIKKKTKTYFKSVSGKKTLTLQNGKFSLCIYLNFPNDSENDEME